jgi:hypothetical protein
MRMKRLLLLFFFASTMLSSFGQVYQPFQQLKSYTDKNVPNKFDSAQLTLTNRLGKEIHYLYPLYQAIGWQKKFREELGNDRYFEYFSQQLAFAGDQQKAIEYSMLKYDSIPDKAANDIDRQLLLLKNIQAADARTSILDLARTFDVVMINGSPAKPFHAAFTNSLLDGLYASGFRFLAIETLNHDSVGLSQLNVSTGYYTAEPVEGELVRHAVELGFKLVSLTDTSRNHSISQRDSVEAVNLISLLRRNPNAKVVVQGINNHSSEEIAGSKFIPVGYWFKKLSRINPLTIDQTDMSEGSNFEYGRIFYSKFVRKFLINSPSIIFANKRPYNPLETKGYDLVVVHPSTMYQNRRATWLSMNGTRKQVLIQPTEKQLFYVQAYYSKEFNSETPNQSVPADQTYVAANDGYYYLWLKKGTYRIVMRDISYKVLSEKELIVD